MFEALPLDHSCAPEHAEDQALWCHHVGSIGPGTISRALVRPGDAYSPCVTPGDEYITECGSRLIVIAAIRYKGHIAFRRIL
jgi:hypothetical protein